MTCQYVVTYVEGGEKMTYVLKLCRVRPLLVNQGGVCLHNAIVHQAVQLFTMR